MAWLLPELDCGTDPELKPLPEFELLELPELELLPELEEPELEEPPEELPVDVAELPEPPVDVADVLWVEPGSTNATTPAVATLATPTAVVAERTLVRPRFRAATALMTLSRSMVSSWGQVLGTLCGLLLRWL